MEMPTEKQRKNRYDTIPSAHQLWNDEIKKLRQELHEIKHLNTIRRRAIEVLIAAGKITNEDWNSALAYIGQIYGTCQRLGNE